MNTTFIYLILIMDIDHLTQHSISTVSDIVNFPMGDRVNLL